MIKIISLYCRGYIAVPVIHACQQAKPDSRSAEDDFLSLRRLSQDTGINAELLFQVLEPLQLFEKDDEDHYRLESLQLEALVRYRLHEVYDIDPVSFLKNPEHGRLLAEKIEQLMLDSRAQELAGGELLEGALMLPLIWGLQQAHSQAQDKDIDELFSDADEDLTALVKQVFAARGWLKKRGKGFTRAGQQLMAAQGSQALSLYRELLARTPEQLFSGKPVAGSVVQEPAETQDVQAGIVEKLRQIFDASPLSEQPGVIVYLGNRHAMQPDAVSEFILTHTRRGKQLEQWPLRQLLIDNDAGTVSRLTDTSADIEGIYADGLTSDAVGKILSRQGIGREQKCLVISHMDMGSLAAHQGDWLEYLQSLGKGVTSWLATAGHQFPSEYNKQYPGETGLALELARQLARQGLMPAEDFIIAAANKGLFNRLPPVSFPGQLAFSSSSVHHFSSRDYSIRHAREEDLPRLYELEKLCWQHTRSSGEQIHSRVSHYPRGQFVLVKDQQVLGVIYSQRIVNSDDIDACQAANVHLLHDESGDTVQLLAVNIDPAVQNLNLGDQLLEFMLQRAALATGVNRVVGITICKNFKGSDGIRFTDYIKQSGSSQDPVLAFHQSHGARVVKAVPGYRPEDEVNQYNGVLVSYDVHNRVPQELQPIAPADAASDKTAQIKAEPAFTLAAIRQLVQDKVLELLGPARDDYDLQRPLMEMGLDSADLLKLQIELEEAGQQKFKSGLFFEYNTAEKVIDFLAAELGVSSEVEAEGVLPAAENAIGSQSKDIAIIGISCKLPGGIENPEQLWQLLLEERDAISQYPKNRGYWPEADDKPAIDLGGFIQGADEFDADFFRIPPIEAGAADPQQRILLQLAWGCLEDACIKPEDIKNSNTGVFVGASNSDYSRLLQDAKLETQAHHATGGSLAVIANRLSYFFDLNGPSLVVDTACSASLVALHVAMQSLNSGECGTALVGGVNLICHPDLSLGYHKAGMLSPDGLCKVFDAGANGYVRSEGAVMMMLKPLERALEDKDQIHAVLKGSASNHGGLAGGLTVPNPKKQSELLTRAWKNAGISAQELDYLEAHGTGTSLGDPIEIQGMQSAFNQAGQTVSEGSCGVGSVKSNLGHLESAAGLTGLLKVVLSMRHNQVPASIHYSRLNPKIQLQGSPLYITDKLQGRTTDKPMLAGVSSFGSGGTNAHVVVSQWKQPDSRSLNRPSLFVLSAKNLQRLQAYGESVINWIRENAGSVSFADFIYSHQAGRTAMNERLAIIAGNYAELTDKLSAWLEKGAGHETLWHNNIANQAVSAAPGIGANDKAQRRLTDMARAWVSGEVVDFDSLYTELPNRVSVAGYPFKKQKFWIQAKPVEAVHPLLGTGRGVKNAKVYSKYWPSLPESFLFCQEEFACLSLGIVLEILVAAGNKINSELELVSLRNLAFYPPCLANGQSFSYQVRCTSLGNKSVVELVHLTDSDSRLIASAEIIHGEKGASRPLVPEYAEHGRAQEDESLGYQLPVQALNAVFPALLDGTSPCVQIPEVILYREPASYQGVVIACAGNDISLFTGQKQPLLSIVNSRSG